MPVKVNLEEAITYDRQVKEIRKRNKKLLSMLGENAGTEFNAGEFLYLFRKSDRVKPVITMVLYWNDEAWDGANSLDELIDFSGAEELRDYVPKHPLRIIDMARLQNTECFKTDLRSVVEYFKRRNDKEAFREYYENCEAAYELDQEGMEVVGALVNSEELLTMLKNKPKEGDGKKMCRAITELIEEGKKEGIREGIREGIKQEQKNTERERVRAEQAEKELERLRKLLARA